MECGKWLKVGIREFCFDTKQREELNNKLNAIINKVGRLGAIRSSCEHAPVHIEAEPNYQIHLSAGRSLLY